MSNLVFFVDFFVFKMININKTQSIKDAFRSRPWAKGKGLYLLLALLGKADPRLWKTDATSAGPI
jgi:hypothetical protein